MKSLQRDRKGLEGRASPSPDVISPEGWAYISSCLEKTRSPLQCEKRWFQLIQKNPSLLWNEDDENTLIILIGRFLGQGRNIDWDDVSRKVTANGSCKSAKQCK